MSPKQLLFFIWPHKIVWNKTTCGCCYCCIALCSQQQHHAAYLPFKCSSNAAATNCYFGPTPDLLNFISLTSLLDSLVKTSFLIVLRQKHCVSNIICALNIIYKVSSITSSELHRLLDIISFSNNAFTCFKRYVHFACLLFHVLDC